MKRRFENRTVLVTGGAAGLGSAIALVVASEGADLVLVDLDPVGLKETARQLGSLGASTSSHTLDLADEQAIAGFASEFLPTRSRLDVLVNNAGLAYGEISSSFETLSQAKWLRYFAINTVAPLLLAQALRPALAQARGTVINQSSMAANTPATAYGVTKDALNAMTYGMAQRFGLGGIRANAVAPGLMVTPAAIDGLSKEVIERIGRMQALKQDGTPEDIARLQHFLASADARFITGEVIGCDGGNRQRGWRH